MAKFDEADPRWLVEQRADGANVNNWHWSERDCMDWSKSRLSQLFSGLVVADGASGCAITINSLETVTGEAFINIRKGKMIPSYELEIKLRWSGELRDGSGSSVGSGAGLVHLPYVADENHDEAPEMKVSCDTADSSSQRLKDQLLGKGKQTIFDTISTFIRELRAGGPAAGSSTAAPPSTAAPTSAQPAASGAPAAAPTPTAAASTAPAPTKPAPKAAKAPAASPVLTLSEKFFARPADLYACFVEEGRVNAFTQSKSSIEPRVGGRFNWLNGSVVGEFLEMQPHSRLVMRWRFNTWEESCSSVVTITFTEPDSGTTLLSLSHAGIPDYDKFGHGDVLESTEKGWNGQVLGRIRSVFGYGV
ncbi:MAG: hypothetical protein WDW38_011278 [Sanguina aurantia]